MSPLHDSSPGHVVTRVANWFRPLLRAMEFTADLCLVLLCAVAFVTAAASLEAPVRFEARDTDTVAYYSLPAFYLTFSSAQPVSYVRTAVLCFVC